MSTSLTKKRWEAGLVIAGYAAGDGTISAAPTPGGELSKQIFLTASDILMYASIWRIYFGEDLSHKQLVDVLTEIGIVTVAAVGTAYVVAKTSNAIMSEIVDWFGPMGWGISAVVTGSLTGLFGAAWVLYCDRLYCEKNPQPTKSATPLPAAPDRLDSLPA